MEASGGHDAGLLCPPSDIGRFRQIERQGLLDEKVDAPIDRRQLLVDVGVGGQADVQRVELLLREHLGEAEVSRRAERLGGRGHPVLDDVAHGDDLGLVAQLAQRGKVTTGDVTGSNESDSYHASTL